MSDEKRRFRLVMPQKSRDEPENDAGALIEVFRYGTGAERTDASDRLALMLLENPDSIRPALADGDKNVRRWAAITVGRAQDASFAFELAAMLADKSKKVRDTAYAVLRDLLDEETLLQVLGKQTEATEPRLRGRIKPYSDRVFLDFQLIRAGLDEHDLCELKRTGFVKVEAPLRRHQEQKGNKLLVN